MVEEFGVSDDKHRICAGKPRCIHLVPKVLIKDNSVGGLLGTPLFPLAALDVGVDSRAGGAGRRSIVGRWERNLAAQGVAAGATVWNGSHIKIIGDKRGGRVRCMHGDVFWEAVESLNVVVAEVKAISRPGRGGRSLGLGTSGRHPDVPFFCRRVPGQRQLVRQRSPAEPLFGSLGVALPLAGPYPATRRARQLLQP